MYSVGLESKIDMELGVVEDAGPFASNLKTLVLNKLEGVSPKSTVQQSHSITLVVHTRFNHLRILGDLQTIARVKVDFVVFQANVLRGPHATICCRKLDLCWVGFVGNLLEEVVFLPVVQ